DEEAKPAAKADVKPAAKADVKPAPKAEAKPVSSKPGAAKPGVKPVPGKPGQKPGTGRPGAKPGMVKAQALKKGVPAKKGGSLGKSMILFVIIVAGLAGGFFFLGREDSGGVNKPKWQTGSTVDVEVTLVKGDAKDLACSSTEEINGKHCAFEADGK